jgi:uncharacterized protein (DUF697 family)
MRLPVAPGAIRKLLKQIEASGRGEHVLAVGGASELAPVLRQQLFRGGADPAAVRLGEPEGADAYVHVISGAPGEQDEAVLRRARLARVPVVAVAVGSAHEILPYVLATDVVRVTTGEAFPLEAIARAVAARLGEDGAPLAARVPLLREAVCEQLVESYARKNGLLAAAVWIPGADLPVLALNELRLVLRLAQAYGEDTGRERLPELIATVGAGFGLRAVARELLDLVPVAGWAVKGVVAYGGTRALGEAARKRFELAPTPPPVAAARAAP